MKKIKSIWFVSLFLLLIACNSEEPVNDSTKEISEAEEIEELEELKEEEEVMEIIGIEHSDFDEGQGFIFSSETGA